jgi:hypothetical protein
MFRLPSAVIRLQSHPLLRNLSRYANNFHFLSVQIPAPHSGDFDPNQTRVGPTVQILLHLLQLQQNQAAANALIAEQSAKSMPPFAQNALNTEPHQQTVKLIQLLLLSQQQQQLQQSMLS